jgi:ribosomal protein S18 acetylase RimI-like enzyme
MAAISETLAKPPADGRLRAFDARRDLSAVADLVELCFADTLDPDGRQYVQQMRSAAGNAALMRWASAAAEWASVPLTGYVWYADGRLVGNTSLIPYHIRGRRFFLIANVAVHPDYRRRGIARGLTLRSVEHARQKGSPSVWLHVREENEGAVALYSGLDFVERARRTSWTSQADYTPVEPLPGSRFTSLKGRHWDTVKKWMEHNYPPELSWHMPLKLNTLRPGLSGSLYRFLYNAYIRQWALTLGSQIVGLVSWQSTAARANALWLAVPPKADERAVHALLAQARQNPDTRRGLLLDYPAHQHVEAIQAAGFHADQTLIWMEYRFPK